jgi:anthranilate synthase component 1
VRGKLAEGLSAVDVLRAGFPAGTVTGSPKVRAMEIIDTLEPARRGPYAGAVGYFDRGGDMEMCIAIRTLMAQKGRVSAQAGAGIVYDSIPAAEYQETLSKARAVFTAVAQAEERLGARLPAREPGRRPPAKSRRLPPAKPRRMPKAERSAARGGQAAVARARGARKKGARR